MRLPSDTAHLNEVVKDVIEKRNSGESIDDLEMKIDLFVFKLYDLNFGEVCIIDKNFANHFTKKEFDRLETPEHTEIK